MEVAKVDQNTKLRAAQAVGVAPKIFRSLTEYHPNITRIIRVTINIHGVSLKGSTPPTATLQLEWSFNPVRSSPILTAFLRPILILSFHIHDAGPSGRAV
jgi:hypothetical protein